MARKGKWSSIRQKKKNQYRDKYTKKAVYKQGQEVMYDSNGNKIYI